MINVPDQDPEFSSEEEAAFAIGAVSRATGIPVETLRVWERRYQAVVPKRDEDNRRYYSAADMHRLKLVKQLVDRGHAVGSVARLDEESLRERLEMHADMGEPAKAPDAVGVMICGELLPSLTETWRLEGAALDILGAYANFADFERAACERRPQVLILETAFLTREQLERLTELGARTAARRCAAIYSYAPAELATFGRKLGLAMRRGPVCEQTFLELCRLDRPGGPYPAPAAPMRQEDADIPPPRFASATLAKIANASTTVRCECPQHLADLVFRIRAFERYSADCQNRNEQDAAIHAALRICAGKARALFEESLAFLIEIEGMNPEWLNTGPQEEDID